MFALLIPHNIRITYIDRFKNASICLLYEVPVVNMFDTFIKHIYKGVLFHSLNIITVHVFDLAICNNFYWCPLLWIRHITGFPLSQRKQIHLYFYITL